MFSIRECKFELEKKEVNCKVLASEIFDSNDCLKAVVVCHGGSDLFYDTFETIDGVKTPVLSINKIKSLDISFFQFGGYFNSKLNEDDFYIDIDWIGSDNNVFSFYLNIEDINSIKLNK